MSNETNIAVVRRYFDQVFNQGRHDLADEFLSEDVELHGTGLAPGLEAVKGWLSMFAVAFPDQQTKIDEVIAEEDRVVVRTTLKATHQGEMQGIPATGKAVRMPAITIFRLDNGRIVEGWLAADNLNLMQQLGVLPG
jgi:steroid delta-isomerase-like uncharacterized protein